MTNETYMKVKEVATILRVHPETVRRAIKAGTIPAIALRTPDRVQGYRISRKWFNEYLINTEVKNEGEREAGSMQSGRNV